MDTIATTADLSAMTVIMLVILVVCVAGVGAMALGIIKGIRSRKPWFLAIALLGAAMLASPPLIYGAVPRLPDVKEYAAIVEDRYGIELTPSQVTDLGFPTEMPGAGLLGEISYATEDKGRTRTFTLQLVSDGDQMMLGTEAAGGAFEELPLR